MKYIGGLLLVTGILLIVLGWIRAVPASEVVILDDQSYPVSFTDTPPEHISSNPVNLVQSPVSAAAKPVLRPVQTSDTHLVPVTGEPSQFTVDDNINEFQFIRAERLAPGSQTNTPVRLKIPAINLDIPVLPATWRKVLYEGYVFDQWKAPKYAGGWQADSAQLGNPGNTVINGHNNEFGEVFKNLDQVQVGDLILAYSLDREFTYVVSNKMVLLEEGESSQQRVENAGWIGKSNDERLTLVTCWPYDTNTHRLIIVARPVTIRNGN
jgi:LPXTG-site transpeptidase (sortase) family protein